MGAPYREWTGEGAARLLPEAKGRWAGQRTYRSTGQGQSPEKERRAGWRSKSRGLAERRWAGVGEEPTPGQGLVRILQVFVLFFSTHPSLAPGPKGALALSKSLMNGWMEGKKRRKAGRKQEKYVNET